MQLINWRIPDNANIFLAGDEHEGTLAQHERGLRQMLNTLESSYAGIAAKDQYLVLHGDMIEGICVDDPRFDLRMNKATTIEQIKAVVKRYMPVRKKIITALDGNHPRKLFRYGDISREICEKLAIIYGTWSSRISYMDKKGRVIFKHYCTHGARSISSNADDPLRRKTNIDLSLKRVMKDKSGDTLLNSRGHSHLLTVCPPSETFYICDNGQELLAESRTSADTGYIHPDLRWYVSTGSFYKAYPVIGESTYVEVAEYNPNECGFAICRIRNRRIEGIDRIVV